MLSLRQSFPAAVAARWSHAAVPWATRANHRGSERFPTIVTRKRSVQEDPLAFREKPTEKWKVGMEAEMETLDGWRKVEVVEALADGSVLVCPVADRNHHRVRHVERLRPIQPFFVRHPPVKIATYISQFTFWVGLLFLAPLFLLLRFHFDYDYMEFVPRSVREAPKDPDYETSIADTLLEERASSMERQFSA